MVCKENVVSWFGNLSSYERIDVMCTLLNMCLPFEVRYLGTCVEDLGKRDYNDLRDTEHRANSASDLAELTTLGVTDKRTRRKLSLYMALLHSCNYACAVILYKNLSNVDFQEIVNLLNGTTFGHDDRTLDELLLLYTMALNHPAFTYEQKSVFGNIYAKLQEEEQRLNPPKIAANSSTFKNTQGCVPNDRVVDAENPTNCLLPPPPMQPFHGDISARTNSMVTGIPPGLTMPPPGLCLPGQDQMSMSPGGAAAQYLHLGFPSVGHMPPWSGQVVMSNPGVLYQPTDVLAYPSSPLVSRQSSPLQSRSPSRSNSPMSTRRSNAIPRTSASSQVSQSGSSTATTSTSTISSQTSITGSNATGAPSVPAFQTLSSAAAAKSQAPVPASQWSVPPPTAGSTSSAQGNSNSRHNTESQSQSQAVSKQTPPPPRLRSTNSIESLRETLGKELPSFKNNLQNYSIDEIRRMGDEELRDLGLPSNAVSQLRSIVKGQTLNGLNPLVAEKKVEASSNVVPHPVLEHVDNEVVRGNDVLSEAATNTGAKCIPLQQQQHQVLHHHHNHAGANVRRYPTIPQMDPSQMQMYPHPPPVYTAPNTQCYACLTMPVAGMQNRYQRCNAQQVYCLAQLQTLRLDPESSRHCSQSSSSESTGSRSPPETPPAAPWVGGVESSVDHANPGPTHHQIAVSTSQQVAQQSIPEKQRNSRKNPNHYVRHKNQMVNGGPPSIPHCGPFPLQPSHSPITYLQHGHFPTLRQAGIYSNFSQAYARPTYPTYQTNGEMMYQYPGGHPGHHPGSGTPPPAAPAQQTTYLPPTPVVTYSTVVPPPKVSCYNCGSSNHHAADCKDQTMEDLTKGAQYRLDYTLLKQPGDCPSSDK